MTLPRNAASKLDAAKLTSLLDAGNLDEARAHLTAALDAATGSADDAAAVVAGSQIYLHVINALNRKYLAKLKRTRALADMVEAQKKDTERLLSVARIKASL